jgi:hypothetical protein
MTEAVEVAPGGDHDGTGGDRGGPGSDGPDRPTGARPPGRRVGPSLPDGLPPLPGRRHRSRVPAFVPAIVGALPLLLVLGSLVIGGGPRDVGDDRALLTMGARDALHGGVLVGPYSRFGWHHPGPSYFYVLALPTWLWRSPTGTWVAAAALASVCAAATIVLVRRAGGPAAGWASAGAVLLVVAGLRPGTFRDPWNPYAVVLPVLLSVVASALGAAGVPGALAWAAVAGSLAVQTHVSTAPVVVGLLVLAVAARGARWGFRRWRRDRSDDAPDALAAVGRPRSRGLRRRPDLWVAVVLLVAEWWPPLWDEWFGSGNLSSLVKFFTAHHPGHGWAESWRLVTAVAGITMFQHHAAFHDGVVDPHPLTTTVIFASLAAGAIGLGLARRRPLAVWLGGAGLLSGVLAVESVTRVVGETYRYLMLWIAVLPVLPAVGVVVALGRSRRRRPPPPALRGAAATALALAVVIPSVLALRGVASTPPAVSAADRNVEAAYRLVAPAVGPGDTTVRIEITDGGTWPAAAGIALDLVRDGHRVRVQPPWTALFGEGRRATGTEAAAIVVAGVNPGTWPPSDQATMLGRVGPEYLFVRRFGPGCGSIGLPFGGPACPPPTGHEGPAGVPAR